MKPPKPRVLCVDDEEHVLSGLKLNLRKAFEVATATSGSAALTLMAGAAPFEVVVSDMRMPGMNGAELLSKIREQWPDTSRVLLTGHSEFDAAVHAVNEGRILRFLTKPCPKDELLEAIGEASRHHRSITAEKVLLQQTLVGTVRALSDTLSLTNPVAFSRGSRIAKLAHGMASDLKLEGSWAVEVAALLSQIGYASVPAAVHDKHCRGQALDAKERAMIDEVPALTRKVLARIPRLEPVIALIGDSRLGRASASSVDANVLRAASDYDALAMQGLGVEEAIAVMRGCEGAYLPEVLTALKERVGEAVRMEIREVRLTDLKTGMILQQDVTLTSGGTLVVKGYVVTPSFIARARNYAARVSARTVKVAVPISPAASAA